MTNAVSRIAGLATLALAALPIAALATGAHAGPIAVKVGDLNLNSADGLAAFHQRTETAATRYCRATVPVMTHINAMASCRTAVRAEMASKMAVVQQAQLNGAATYAAR
jgi:UrcA family protein